MGTRFDCSCHDCDRIENSGSAGCDFQVGVDEKLDFKLIHYLTPSEFAKNTSILFLVPIVLWAPSTKDIQPQY